MFAKNVLRICLVIEIRMNTRLIGIGAYTVSNMLSIMHTKDGNHKYGFEFVISQMFLAYLRLSQVPIRCF